MRFGTFHLIGAPNLEPAEQRINDTLAQLALADELGFQTAWIAEHHFSNYGYSVNPLLLIARASSIAPRLTFSQAVIVTPFWHPIRLAEDIALTDILTGGRLELGLGRGYQPMEFVGLDLKIEESRAMFREQHEIMLKCWTEDDFTYQGQHFQITSPITVLPRPVQRPHPPIWVATFSEETLEWTAAHGYGTAWSGTLMTREQMVDWTKRFRKLRAAAGQAVTGEATPICVQRFVYVTESEEQARQAMWQTRWQRRVADGLKNFPAGIRAGRNEEHPSPGELSDEAWWDKLVYGTPERCIQQFRRDAELGVSDLVGWFDIGGLPQSEVLRSMRLFAREVLPALSETKVG